MKMTDESALAVLDSILMRISFSNSERAINNLPEHAAMRDHISARLAADQQKGGGEVVAQLYVSETSVDLCPIAPGKLSDGEIRRRYGTGTHDLFARAEPKGDDNRLASMIEHGMSGVDWSPAPQPSIPAPAQQEVDVGRLRALIANWQTPPTRAGESWITTQARQACAHQLNAALAHPPHADQETQG